VETTSQNMQIQKNGLFIHIDHGLVPICTSLAISRNKPGKEDSNRSLHCTFFFFFPLSASHLPMGQKERIIQEGEF
jgi:hypothetical protein